MTGSQTFDPQRTNPGLCNKLLPVEFIFLLILNRWHILSLFHKDIVERGGGIKKEKEIKVFLCDRNIAGFCLKKKI